MDSCGEPEGARDREIEVFAEETISLHEVRAALHRIDRNHARSDRPHAGKREPSDRPFGKHAQAFLDALIFREAGSEDRKPLRTAVDEGQEMCGDFVREARPPRPAWMSPIR